MRDLIPDFVSLRFIPALPLWNACQLLRAPWKTCRCGDALLAQATTSEQLVDVQRAARQFATAAEPEGPGCGPVLAIVAEGTSPSMRGRLR